MLVCDGDGGLILKPGGIWMERLVRETLEKGGGGGEAAGRR